MADDSARGRGLGRGIAGNAVGRSPAACAYNERGRHTHWRPEARMCMATEPDNEARVPAVIERFVRQLIVADKAVSLYPPSSAIPRDTARDAVAILDEALARDAGSALRRHARRALLRGPSGVPRAPHLHRLRARVLQPHARRGPIPRGHRAQRPDRVPHRAQLPGRRARRGRWLRGAAVGAERRHDIGHRGQDHPRGRRGARLPGRLGGAIGRRDRRTRRHGPPRRRGRADHDRAIHE